MGAGRPPVTVITLCFNHEPYLDDYCRGLLAQTYEHVELVIFDDGSTDDSWQKISDYVPALERKFTRVVAERHENIGAAEELILATGRAEGELMCVLDSDDYYLPEKLEENVRFMRANPDAVAVHSDTDIIHSGGIERSHWRRKRTIPTGDVYAELLTDNFVMSCAFCCRTDAFRRYVPFEDYARRGYLVGDYARSLDLAKRGPFGYIDRSLARYRVVEGSRSHPRTREEQLRFLRSMYEMRLDYLDDPRVTPALAEQVERDYYWIRYQQGVEFGRLADCEEGYRWLRAHYPKKYRWPHHGVAVRVVRIRTLWRLGRAVGAIPFVLRIVWAYRRRHEHRELRAALEPMGAPGRR